MKRFSCPSCGIEVHFHNAGCVACGTQIGFDPGVLNVASIGPSQRCLNAPLAECNWVSHSADGFCRACQHNRTVPDADVAQNRPRWAAIEGAKRQLFYSLIRWNLPIPLESDGAPLPLEFDFLADTLAASGKPKPVLTGHANGLITLNIAEGDDATREARRSAMGEPFRTLVGHMRHEIAHYYWELLVQNTDALPRFRALFGDETGSYKDALKQHYENGPPPDWALSHISAYAAAHPWEDFAETFAHWVHMVDGLDTAWAYDIVLSPGLPRFDSYAAPDAQSLIDAWVPVTIAINAVNRSLGQPDLYPFVLSSPVVDKLEFIHSLIAPFRG